MADRQFLERLSRQLADEGRLIEVGWVALRLNVIPLDASAVQLSEMRMAYMAGAQHLFSSIMHALDPDAEPTESDMRRMELIDRELRGYQQELELRVGKPAGTG